MEACFERRRDFCFTHAARVTLLLEPSTGLREATLLEGPSFSFVFGGLSGASTIVSTVVSTDKFVGIVGTLALFSSQSFNSFFLAKGLFSGTAPIDFRREFSELFVTFMDDFAFRILQGAGGRPSTGF
jgi:hypothetical protein